MKVCILGGGLTSLTLAKTLVNQGIRVDLVARQKLKKPAMSRSLGISKNNVQFFKKNILDIHKLLWKIKKIKIYSTNLKSKNLLNFENNNDYLFSMVKNYELYDILINDLKKNKFFQIKKKIDNKKLLSNYYKLVINCDLNNSLTKKFFSKKMNKNYSSYAHTTIINHKKNLKNNIATQVFTKDGPLAFLPLSETETSVVYSARGPNVVNLKSIINKYNNQYSINKIEKIFSFKLKSSNLRIYHYKNILAFGDLLHTIHPLAGQGFNMTIRDIKELLNIIKFKMGLGLEMDKSICVNFQKKIKHKNYFFSQGIDFVYELFKLESKVKNSVLSKSIKLLGKNEFTKNFLIKIADEGFRI